MINRLKVAFTQNRLIIFLTAWTVINLVQAAFTGLHPDEAYYWIYSRYLDWGYFDHPPMIALFIKMGDLLFHSQLSLRLLTVLTNTLSLYMLWKIAGVYCQDIKLFILLFSSVLLLHVYAFITTPDSPLLFFSIAYFYIYQQYVGQDKLKWTLWLCLIVPCLLYSKYHGILILAFTVLSNFQLLKRFSFWLIVVISVVLYLPHLYWQYVNGFPSVYYHLFDRSAFPYSWKFTTDYLLSQVLIAGPLTGWFLYKSAVKVKSTDAFVRTLKFTCWGVFIFFLLSTFKGHVEAHWTLVAFPPMLILSFIFISRMNSIPMWFKNMLLINICLILIMRLILIIPFPFKNARFVSLYYNSDRWAKQIHQKADNSFVIFQNNFQEPALYDFYNKTTKGFAYDSREYRKTQFDIWPIEDSLRNNRIYYVLSAHHSGSTLEDTIATPKGTFYGIWINKVRLYQKVAISTDPFNNNWVANRTYNLNLRIFNPYNETISFNNSNQKWKCYLEYGFLREGELKEVKPTPGNFQSLNILPHQTVQLSENITAPNQSGKYKMIFQSVPNRFMEEETAI